MLDCYTYNKKLLDTYLYDSVMYYLCITYVLLMYYLYITYILAVYYKLALLYDLIVYHNKLIYFDVVGILMMKQAITFTI